MKYYFAVALLFLVGCNVQTNNSSWSDSMLYSTPSTPVGASTNFAAARTILVQNCASCHEHTSWGSYSEQDFLNNSYVVAGNLAGSAIWTKLSANGGDMPQVGSISAAQVDTLKTWILQIGKDGTTTQSPSFLRTQAAMGVLTRNCISCHGVSQNGTVGGPVPAFAAAVQAFNTSGDDLVANQFFVGGVSNLVTAGNASDSWIYESLKSYGTIGSEPNAGTALSASDAQAIADWINGLGQ